MKEKNETLQRVMIGVSVSILALVLGAMVLGPWANQSVNTTPADQAIRQQVEEAVKGGNEVREYDLYPGLNILQIDVGGGVRAVGPVTCEVCGAPCLLGQSWYVDGDYVAHTGCDGVVVRDRKAAQ